MAGSVIVGRQLKEQLNRIISDALPGVLPRMEAEVQSLMDEAVAGWPVQDRGAMRRTRKGVKGKEFTSTLRRPERVGTPHSRDQFRTETVILPDAVEVRLANDSPYLFFVKSDQKGLGGKSAWVTLIRTPARKRAKQLAEDLGTELTKLAGG